MSIIRSPQARDYFYLTGDGIFALVDGITPSYRELLKIKSVVDELLSQYTDEQLEQERIMAFAQIRAECNAESQARQEKKAPPPSSRQGFVYLMFDTSLQVYKVGFSQNPQARETTLQAEKPSIDLVFCAPGSMLDEQQLHQKFAAKRLRGEWFRLSPDDVEEIRAGFRGEVQ